MTLRTVDPLGGIVQFNNERKLTTFNATAEAAMLQEELQEFIYASAQDDTHELVDALCDIIVLATGAIHKLGYDPEMALDETVREILSRRGSFNESTGKWEKDLNQDPATLYKADYKQASYS